MSLAMTTTMALVVCIFAILFAMAGASDEMRSVMKQETNLDEREFRAASEKVAFPHASELLAALTANSHEFKTEDTNQVVENKVKCVLNEGKYCYVIIKLKLPPSPPPPPPRCSLAG